MTTAPAPKLTPFLLFEGNCAEAMEFYRSCLGGELVITRVGDMGDAAPELSEKVAHAHLESGTIEFSAADWQHPTRKPVRGNTVAMYVDGGPSAQLTEILLDPLCELLFGTYGHLADKFGVHWFFHADRLEAGPTIPDVLAEPGFRPGA
jgi:PhnB protein